MFFVLDGELVLQVGPELERMTAGPGTFVLVPPHVVHTFQHAGPAGACWLNLHAPSTGFADFLETRTESGIASPLPKTVAARRTRRSSSTSTPHRAHNM